MGTDGRTGLLPHWDLTAIYSDLEGDDFTADFEAFTGRIAEIERFFDDSGIAFVDGAVPADEAAIHALEMAIGDLNAVEQLGHKLYAFVAGYISTDSRNTQAQTWMSKLQMQLAALEKLDPRFTAWVGSLDLDNVLIASPLAMSHEFVLRRAQTEAHHLMSPSEENLAADLNLTGGRAWSKLYNNFSSQIMADVEIKGERRSLPMTAVRNLAYNADRDARKHAYEVELATWQANAVPIAAALNSIKGQANTLNQRRGWKSPVDLALFNNAIDRATLDAMMGTAREFFPHFRRYLDAKAQLLGADKCAWYDLFAPVGTFKKSWTYDTAESFIIDQFASFAPSLSSLARRAFAERWIDAEPRDGKRGGAFCMWVGGDRSRILANYQDSYGGVSTLAHELGHAYHNLCLADRTYMQRRTPMTLAETASTFCQIIVREAALRDAPEAEQMAILEADLQDATQVIVDISSRFLFESEVFERRQHRELSPEELCGIMTESQLATYGEGLDSGAMHPYMWAVKPHYYSAVFYNFPYMFGLLFALGVYAKYREAPGDFVARYESLLSGTGMADAVNLAKRFGIDITRSAFWESSLSIIVEDINRFRQLAAAIDQTPT